MYLDWPRLTDIFIILQKGCNLFSLLNFSALFSNILSFWQSYNQEGRPYQRKVLSSNSSLHEARGVFNNASARSAIECFLSERKRSPRCLRALAIQVDRCIAWKSNMATKTIMGFREGLCTQYFQIRFSEWRCMFFVWICEMEHLKLKVGRCFALIIDHCGDLICLLLGAAIF